MMLSIVQLWLPILASAIAVFVASSVIHMVLQWHKSDYRGFSNEDEVLAAIRKGNPQPGIHMLPFCKDMKDMGSPEVMAKFREGPTGKFVLRAGCEPGMGKPLAQWFVLSLVISLFCALIAATTMGVGADHHAVFHVVALAAFMGYGFGAFIQGIWWGQPWGAVAKDAIDGVVYALVTAGVFAWLWPH